MKECPYCAEEIQDKAIKCKHCGEWLENKDKITVEHTKSDIIETKSKEEVKPQVTVSPTYGWWLPGIIKEDRKDESISDSIKPGKIETQKDTEKQPQGPVLPVHVYSSPTQYNKAIQRSDPGPKGVGGWLGFFIFQIVILSPLMNLSEILSFLSKVDTYIADQSSFMIVKLLHYLLIIWVIFGVFTGILLFQVRKHAIKITKIFLLTSTGYIFIWGLSFYTGPESLGRCIAFLLYFTAWYFYFNKSKRVKNTFGG